MTPSCCCPLTGLLLTPPPHCLLHFLLHLFLSLLLLFLHCVLLLLLQQNNLSNPPTPPASLPPTPPPLPRQKLLNGFASTDELSRKDVQAEQEGACGSGDHRGSAHSSSGSLSSQVNVSLSARRCEEEEGGGASVPEPQLQDGGRACLPADAAPQHPGGAQVRSNMASHLFHCSFVAFLVVFWPL